MKQTPEQLQQNAEVEQRVIASIERTNWTDKPLTVEEKHVIGMAVSSVLYAIRSGELVLL